MRYLVATILLAIGVAILGVAVAAYMQLRMLATQVELPDMDNYPALMFVASDLWEQAVDPQQAVPPKPHEIAQQTMQRIWLIGFAGIVVVVMGLVALVLWPHKRRKPDGT